MEIAKRRLLGALILSLFAAVLGDEKKEVKEGLDVELRCDYTISDPRVEWKFSSGQNTDLFIYYNGALTVPYQSRAQYFPHGLMLKSVTRKDTGEYVCEVTDSGGVNPTSHNYKTLLTVLVPPSVPVARVPTSVTIGSANTLQCLESDASRPRTIVWYKDKVQLPQDPKNDPLFQNLTYTMDPTTGDLTFNPVTLANSGQYYCVVSNSEGQQKSAVVTMEAYEKNVGGIVAAVIVVLLILVLIGFLVWFAYSRGYIGKKANKKVIYSQPSETRSDKNFQQTSSFVV